MPKNPWLPKPHCPRCSDPQPKVTDTYYLKDFSQIIRRRRCSACKFIYFASQPREVVLDPSETMVKIPNWQSASKTCTLVNLNSDHNANPSQSN